METARGRIKHLVNTCLKSQRLSRSAQIAFHGTIYNFFASFEGSDYTLEVAIIRVNQRVMSSGYLLCLTEECAT